jgi:hypothetical protein
MVRHMRNEMPNLGYASTIAVRFLNDALRDGILQEVGAKRFLQRNVLPTMRYKPVPRKDALAP